MSHKIYLQIVSGQAPGLIGVPARLMLTALSWPYAVVVRVRNYLYTAGWLKARRVGVPVICIGNLTTGGTGKTPLVVWLYRYLRDRQVRCAVLTRGYKMRRDELSDEPALLASQCPDAAVIVNPDRVAGAAEAIRRFGDHAASECGQDARVPQGRGTLATGILVMDDGFQHRRLARDLDIVAIDATRPFGPRSVSGPLDRSGRRGSGLDCGKVLPAGLLREPVASLRRAHAVVLTRCDQVSEETLACLEEQVRRINPDLTLARSMHVPTAAQTHAGVRIGLDQLRGRRLFAFCGIGNPQSFLDTVEHLGAILVGSRQYDDHYRYRPADLAQIRGEAAASGATLILTTQKDWTKAARWAGPQDEPPVAYLAVELRLTAGAHGLTALIDGLVGGIMPPQ